MKEKLFRENTVKKISTPENMNEYIKVIRFHVWPVVLITILAILGIILWVNFSNNSLLVTTAGESKNGVLTCYISEKDYDDIKSSRDEIAVRVAENEDATKIYGSGELLSISERPIELSGDIDPYILHLGGFYEFEWAYEIKWQTDLPDGIYSTIVYRVATAK